jgi:hypothetical protein
MPENPERLAERLTAECQKTIDFFRVLTPEQWDFIVYTAGPAWTARDLLAHFVSAERAIKNLVAYICAGGIGAPEDFDIDGFNAVEVADLAGHTVDELLTEFDDNRRETVAMVAQMQPADLQKSGRHPFLGWVTTEDMLKLLYRHDQIHLRDLRRLLKTATGE